jgi:hypothetical protein
LTATEEKQTLIIPHLSITLEKEETIVPKTKSHSQSPSVLLFAKTKHTMYHFRAVVDD